MTLGHLETIISPAIEGKTRNTTVNLENLTNLKVFCRKPACTLHAL